MQEIGTLDAGNETYEKINKNQEEFIQDYLEYNPRLKPSNGSKDKSQYQYWIPKLHENPAGSLLRQKIDITVGIDPALFWANLFLYTY